MIAARRDPGPAGATLDRGLARGEVFVTSPWIPPEWILAHGLQPRVLDPAPGLARPPRPIAAGVCPLAWRVEAWATERPGAALVLTTTCDQLRRTADTLARMPSRRLFLFNLPAAWQSPAARRMYHAEVRRLSRFLAQVGGHPLARGALPGIMERLGRARAQLEGIARTHPGRPFAEAMARFLATFEAPSPPPRSAAPVGVPLALVGGPLLEDQRGLLDVLARAGASVVVNGTANGERALLPPPPPVRLGADPARILVDHYWQHGLDIAQRPATRLHDWLAPRLRDRHVRGIVVWQFLACDLWRAEAAALRDRFALPVLLLEAHDAAALGVRERTRLDAFVEMLG